MILIKVRLAEAAEAKLVEEAKLISEKAKKEEEDTKKSLNEITRKLTKLIQESKAAEKDEQCTPEKKEEFARAIAEARELKEKLEVYYR